MGPAHIEELHSALAQDRETVILNVGNPQCAVFVRDFDFDWRRLGAEVERIRAFPIAPTFRSCAWWIDIRSTSASSSAARAKP